MRASEFIFELTNPSDPPPKAGTPEFEKSMRFFIEIVQKNIKTFNDELQYISRTNPVEYSKRIADEDELRDELKKFVIDELIKRGAGNFVNTDKTIFYDRFDLNNTNAPFNSATNTIDVKNMPIAALTLTATDNWYKNRYTKYTDSELYAKISGASEKISGYKVAKLDLSVARQLIKSLSVKSQDPNFWEKIKSILADEKNRNTLYNTLYSVYKIGASVSGTEYVTPLDVRAAKELTNLLGKKVDSDEFWSEFTQSLEDSKTLKYIKSIFDRYYK